MHDGCSKDDIPTQIVSVCNALIRSVNEFLNRFHNLLIFNMRFDKEKVQTRILPGAALL